MTIHSEMSGLSQVALVSLLVFWSCVAIQMLLRRIIFPNVYKDLLALNRRRSQSIREALAVRPLLAYGPTPPVQSYPFSGWVELTTEGTVKIAGESFSLQQPFEITARDENNIPRAAVLSQGKGEVFISSHGETFKARFGEEKWDVQPASAVRSLHS